MRRRRLYASEQNVNNGLRRGDCRARGRLPAETCRSPARRRLRPPDAFGAPDVSGPQTSPAPRRLRRGDRRSGVERGVLGAGARPPPSPRTAPPNLRRRVFRVRAPRRESRGRRLRGGGSRAPGRASTAVRRVSDVVPSVPRPLRVGNPRSLRGRSTIGGRVAGPAPAPPPSSRPRASGALAPSPAATAAPSLLPPATRAIRGGRLGAPARRREAYPPSIAPRRPLASGGGGRTVLECAVVRTTCRGSP